MKAKTKGYYKLREEIDWLAKKLEKQHKKHLACKMGCDLCCMDYSLLPVEFYSIANALKDQNLKLDYPSVTKEGNCVFLKDHKCTIYSERPIICRTHGLPLLYMNENEEWELSACELNFTTFDMDDFTNENTFPQDRFNSDLFMLNKEFIRELKDKNYGEFDLIPLRELINHLETRKY